MFFKVIKDYMSKNGKDHLSKPASPLPKGATRMERRAETS